MRIFAIACYCLFLNFGCDQVRFIPIQGENKKVVEMDCGRHLQLTLTTSLSGRRGLHYKVKIVNAVNGMVIPNNVTISTGDKAIHYKVYSGRSDVINGPLNLENVSNLDYFFELPSDSVVTVTISGNKFLLTGVDTCGFGPVTTRVR